MRTVSITTSSISTPTENFSAQDASQLTKDNMRRISQSEATSWLMCKAKYRYEFDMNLERITQSDALSMGNLGHEALEIYYRARMEGDSHDDSVIQARKVFMGALDTYGMEIIARIDPLLQRYWAFYDPDEWEILAVEEAFDLPLTDDYTMPTRLDVIVRERKNGKMAVVDHKFKGEFIPPITLSLNAQMPKYIASLRNLGYNVDYAILNILRTRKMKDPTDKQLFQRSVITPGVHKTRNVLRQQIIASREITKYRDLPPDQRKQVATPVLNELVCNRCAFAELCASEMDGGEIEYLIANEFQQRESYGYNEDHKQNVMEKL